MNLLSSQPFWSVSNGIPANYPRLQHEISCEVLVVGGGITGALVAFHLVEAGVQTVVIDKRDIGTGSTSGSTALLQYEIDTPLRVLSKKVGEASASRSYQLCYETIGKLAHLAKRLKIDCGFKQKPSLYLARHQNEIGDLQEEHRLRRKLGIKVQFLDAAAIRSHLPFERPAALFSEEGGQVDPHRLTHGLLAAGKRRGLEVYDRTEMLQWKSTTRGMQITTKDGYRITARRVVIAAGFEAREILKADAGTLKSTYALITEPIEDFKSWYQDCLIWETGLPYLYIRSSQDGRIIIGGEDESFVNPKRRDALISKKTRVLQGKFHRLFPAIQTEVAYSWAGTFGETKDGLPYIGIHPRFPHAYFALGYGGNGITFSLIAAELIRDNFLERVQPDFRLFRFGR